MIEPSAFSLLHYAHQMKVQYLYDANHDGIIDHKDVNLIKMAQPHEHHRHEMRPMMKMCKG